MIKKLLLTVVVYLLIPLFMIPLVIAFIMDRIAKWTKVKK